MKERPILFSARLVRAILDGRKTQTRRVIRPTVRRANGVGVYSEDERGVVEVVNTFDGEPIDAPEISCPYGEPGDRLWVRETWAHYQTVNHVQRSDGRAFDEVSDGLAGYRADGHETIQDFRDHVRLTSGCDLQDVLINGNRWRPSIHMPRWASRITLEVTEVRVERLQAIDEEDARAEGVTCWVCDRPVLQSNQDACACFHGGDARVSFCELWDDINARRGFGWASNPWVWVISFRRLR